MNFEKLTAYLDEMPGRGVPGCDMQVWINHQPVYRHLSGEARPGEPLTGNETYWFYSASKVVCMTAAMQLVDRGLIDLDDPVSKYLPAYANLTVKDEGSVRPAKNVLTIRHLMSMQGGLNYDLNSPAIRACLKRCGSKATTRQLVDALAEQPLDFEPGTHFQYSLCHDVVAGVIEVASGMTYGEYLQKNIFDPLGVTCLKFHPTHEDFDRMAARYLWDGQELLHRQDNRPMPYALSESHESGGAGLMGDAASYMLVADALANDGVGKNGVRILSREAIDTMRTPQLTGVSAADFDALGRTGYTYALGVRTLVDGTASKSPVGEFGWDSAAAAYVMIDPDNHIAAFYSQHVLGCGRAYVEFHPAMRDLIYEALEA